MMRISTLLMNLSMKFVARHVECAHVSERVGLVEIGRASAQVSNDAHKQCVSAACSHSVDFIGLGWSDSVVVQKKRRVLSCAYVV